MNELLSGAPKLNIPLSVPETFRTGLLFQFIRYGFVGGVAFVADASALYLLHWLGLYYLAAGALAFLAGLIVNFLLAKRLVFTRASKRTGRLGEFAAYGLIGLTGLGLTELLLFVFTEFFGLYFMLSKAVAAALVLLWNFAARKIILY